MAAAENRRGGRVKGMFNVSCLSTALFGVYISYVAYNMHGVMNPMRNAVIEPGAPTIKPLWSEGTKMTATCYLAASKTFHAAFLDRSSPSAARVPLVGRAEGLTFDHEMTGHSFDLNLTALSAGADDIWPNTTMLDDRDWSALMSNKTMYFHVLLEAESPKASQDGQQGLWNLLGSVPLVKHGPPPKTRATRRLLSDIGIGGVGGVLGGAGTSGSSAGETGAGAGRAVSGGAASTGGAAGESGGGGEPDFPSSSAKSRKGNYISFWKPEVAVRVVTDFTEYPHNYLPHTIQRSAEIIGLTKDGRWADDSPWDSLAYKPIVHVDEIGLTSDKYVPLNNTLSSLPLKITIEPMSLQRWQLMQSMEHSLQQQKESFGFQDSDVDDLRRLISDTNVYLLIITLLASTLHLLFEFLAFKSDVDFWRRNKSLRGLSVRTLFMEVFFQTVILLSLIEEDASLLVTVPAGVGVLIQIWKVRRATGMQIGWGGLVFTRLEKADGGGKGKAGGGAGREGGWGKQAGGTAAGEGTGTGTDAITPLLGSKNKNGGGAGREGGGGKQAGGTAAGEGTGTGTDANTPLLGSKNGGGGGGGDSSVRRRKGTDKGGDTKDGGVSVQQKGGGGGEGSGADQAMETMRYDRMAIAYLSLILLPLVVGYSAKKLVMDEHAGWYSWALQSVTAFVYTFGFVLMTPQLYINYKLKSVAHLPWRFLCYRSLNTVIDDLFAFVIRMPAMHRLSCFRDDVVFVVYLYQRWIYPVDANRPQDRGA